MTPVQLEIGQSKFKYKDKGLQEGCPRKTSQLILWVYWDIYSFLLRKFGGAVETLKTERKEKVQQKEAILNSWENKVS